MLLIFDAMRFCIRSGCPLSTSHCVATLANVRSPSRASLFFKTNSMRSFFPLSLHGVKASDCCNENFTRKVEEVGGNRITRDKKWNKNSLHRFLVPLCIGEGVVVALSFFSSLASYSKLGVSVAYYSTWCRMGDLACGGLVFWHGFILESTNASLLNLV